MATATTKRGKTVRRFLWAIVIAIVLVALLPVWFPWVLKPVLNHFGINFTRYDRLGYTHFALVGVTGTWENSDLKVKRVECVLPTIWLWRKLADGTNTSPYLIVLDAKLAITNQTAATAAPGGTEKEQSSLNKTANQTIRVARTLERFAPVARLTNGTVQIASNNVFIPRALWRAGRLQATAQLPKSNGDVGLAGRLKGKSSFELSARWDAYNASVYGEFSKKADGWRLDGNIDWLTNHAIIMAQFATKGWWPAKAQLNCPELEVPGDLIHLRSYKDLNATLAAGLSSNQFNLQTTGFAHPTGDLAVRGFQPVKFSIAANGNPEVVNLRTLRIQSPWLKADLVNSVGMTWQGELLAKPALLHVQADLDKMPGAPLSGQANAEVRVVPHGRRRLPTVRFICSVTNLRTWQVDAEHVVVKGEFTASKLRVEKLTADLPDNSKLLATGSYDFKTQQIADGRWEVSGSYFKKFLPGVSYHELSGSGRLNGTFTNFLHGGELTVKGLDGLHLSPLDTHAKWNGRNLQLDSLEVGLTAAESDLSIGGAVDLSGFKRRKGSLFLTYLTLRRAKEKLYALRNPCAISFHLGTNSNRRKWTLSVDGFDWEGTNRTVLLKAGVSWPEQGKVTAALTNVALSNFSDFLSADLPDSSLAALHAEARWSNGPVHSAISIAGALTNRSGQRFALAGALAVDDALDLKQLSIVNGYTPTLSVTGSVPCRIVPTRPESWLVWDTSRPIALAGAWEDHESQQLSLPLGGRGSIEVAQPELALQISGTPEKPSASLQLAAATISWQSSTNEGLRPEMKDFHLRTEIRPDQITLTKLSAMLDGQPIDASGVWPLSEGAWRSLWSEHKLPEWMQARGSLRVQDAQVAAISRYLPQVLAPEGKLSANLELKPGKQFSGDLLLTNAATRSLAKLTPLRDIAAHVRLDGQRATLDSFRGQIGGQPVRADGFLTVTNGALDYQVHVSGTNVPLARSLELLLRGDFDLQLRGASNLPPMLSGGLNVHDGLFVQHASALVWSGPKRPELRAPYFSVTNEPFADWKLDLAVAGDRFLRVRNPFFNGSLAANLKLTGSLSRPVLTGDVRVDSGRIAFPFGTLDVDQGFASFTGNDPRGPDLQIAASGRNYRYDIRLEVKGPASVADVTFSSTPPLASEQILLMLTAGEIPQTEFAYSSEAKVGRLATFLGKDLLNRFLGAGRSEERLIIRTGESISEEGRLTYAVEYRITDWLSIIGEYDEYNAFNADLKWKIFTR